MQIKNTIILIILSITLSSCAVLEVIYITPGIIMWQIDQWLENDPVKYADLEANPYKCCSEDYLEHLPEPPIIEIPFNAHKAGEEITIDFKVPEKSRYRYMIEFHPQSLLEKKILDSLYEDSVVPLKQEFILYKLHIGGSVDKIAHLKGEKQGRTGDGQAIYPVSISGKPRKSSYIENLVKSNLQEGYYRVTVKNLIAIPKLKSIKTTFSVEYGRTKF